MEKRSFIYSLVAILVSVFIGFGSAFAEEEKKLEQVTFHYNWQINYGTHAGVVVGIEKGFFAEEGIELVTLPGSGSVVAIKGITMGKADFGLVSASELMIAKSKNEVPIKLLACLNQKGMTALFFRKDSGIKTAKDFEGKSIACNPKSLKTEAAKIYLTLNGVDISKVKFVGAPNGQDLKYVMLGKADACTYSIESGLSVLKAKGEQDNYGYIYLEDNGITMMDLCYVVNEKIYKENPELVKRFMRAMMKSWRYANANRDEAKELYQKHVPISDMADLKSNEDMEGFLQWRTETLGRPLGWISIDVLKKTQDILIKAKKIEKEMDLNEIYTNEFIY